MRCVLATALALASLASRGAPAKAPAPTGEKKEVLAPGIQFAEVLHDFGTVKSGEVVRHDFVFTNTGAAVLEISDVRPSCGCTTAGAWDKRVEPGKTGAIPLLFNTDKFAGMVTKAATVTCNDPIRSTVLIQLTGRIWNPIEVTPGMPVFMVSGENQTNETKVVRIVNNLEEPVELSAPECTNRTFKAELKTVRAGKEFELHITAVPPFTPPSIVAPIVIHTTNPKMPTLSLTTFVVVQPSVTVSPSQITLPPGPLTNATSSVITIRNNRTNSLQLSDTVVNFPGPTLRLRETEPGRLFSLTADFPQGYQVHPGQTVEISLKSSDPKFPVLRVPVLQSPAAASRDISRAGAP